MKIKRDLLRVRNLPVDDAGQKIEPEQQLVQRVLQVDSEVSMQGGDRPVGSIPTEIIYDTSAGEMAAAMRRPCFSCRHFNTRAWKALHARWADNLTPKDERNQLNAVRAALLQTSNAKLQDAHLSQEGDMDVEHALSVLGVCEPLSEIRNTPVVVYPTASCPGDVCTPTQPNGFYKPKDKESDKLGGQVFDNLMKLATGKKIG